MADAFLLLPDDERKEALQVAASKLNRPAHLLEKDVWVVWALRAMFRSPFGEHITFKGGTSLSKAYHVIQRFSEDVDLTIDIRWIAEDLVDADDPIPPTAPLARKWSEKIRAKLERLINDEIAPFVSSELARDGLLATVTVSSEKVFIGYAPVHQGTGYVEPRIVLEFGARSTGEPSEERNVVCEAASALPTLTFPDATPRAMRPERTFWEKATAIHVYCIKGRFRGGKGFARHWYDLVALDEASFGTSALADHALAEAVARHKAVFFVEKDATGAEIDYGRAVAGALRLVPTGAAATDLAKDYHDMVRDGLLTDGPPALAQLLEACRSIEQRANARSAR
jgi:Nucleotidyl transferase AbiEii toxin, Type IV TA system